MYAFYYVGTFCTESVAVHLNGAQSDLINAGTVGYIERFPRFRKFSILNEKPVPLDDTTPSSEFDRNR